MEFLMKNITNRSISILIYLLVFLIAIFNSTSQAEPKASLKVGVYPTTYTRLIAIADVKGYFKKSGIEVTIKKYPSGTSALNAVIQEEVDIGTVVDFRFAWKMLEEPLIRVVASTGEVFESRIIARKDRGIRQPSDLKGKRVGFVSNTISEYALDIFLLEYNISPSEINAVPIPIREQTAAVVTGEVDAISAFVTFAFDAVDSLGDNGLAWDSTFHTTYNALLVIKEGMIQSPETISSFLKALIMAETFSHLHEEEAKRIIMEDWGFSRKVIDQFWDKTRITVSLNQSIITSLNLYAKWLIKKNKMNIDPPNVLNFINTDPLDRIAPERITIFR